MLERVIDILFVFVFSILTLFVLTKDLRAEPAAHREVFLKNDIVVEGKQVTLGDLFTDAGEVAPAVVSAAPPPGSKIFLSSTAVAAMARNYGLQWKNLAQLPRITVTRASRTVTLGDVMPSLEEALVAAGSPVDHEILLSDTSVKVNVAADAQTLFEIKDLAYDRSTGAFTADLDFPFAGNDEAPGYVRPIQGRVFAVRSIPVLANTIESGQVISGSDIEWKTFRLQQVSRNVLTAEDEIVDLEARRRLEPGRPIYASDIRKPVVVTKGKLLTILYKTPGLSLTVEGRALEQGGVNDSIRVMNTRSNRTIVAQVIGPSEVAASPGYSQTGR